jgi:hypothetical protein
MWTTWIKVGHLLDDCPVLLAAAGWHPILISDPMIPRGGESAAAYNHYSRPMKFAEQRGALFKESSESSSSPNDSESQWAAFSNAIAEYR